MPFTLAHPAITIPLKRFLPFSALIVGSLSPDFEYLFRLTPVSKFSHTLSGIFYFCIPVSLVFLWLFHSVVKYPVLALFPSLVRRRFQSCSKKFSFFPLPRLFIIILALVVGAFSHILWDSFTHESGWVVSKLPLLQASLFNLDKHEIKLYKLLQHGSSAVGLSLITYCFLKWFNNKPVDELKVEQEFPDRIRHQISIGLILLTCIIALGVGFWSASGNTGLRYLEVFAVQTAIGGMAAFALCLLLFSFIYKASNRTRGEQTDTNI